MKSSPASQPDPFENEEIKHLQLFLYLIPVFGFFPALWTLYRREGTREQRRLCRLTIALAFAWLVSYGSFALGTNLAEGGRLTFLLASSLATSGYFLVNIWLMVRLWQRRRPRLPWASDFSERVLRKYLP